jgi:hypothetical protein
MFGSMVTGGFGLFNPNIEKNLMPSEYSKLNYDFDGQSLLGSFHLLISHILGLYYQGLVYKTKFDLNERIDLDLTSLGLGQGPLYLSYHILNTKRYHGLFNDKLFIFQLPVILNYLILSNEAQSNVRGNMIDNILTSNSKYTYYNIEDRELRIPTHNAYANALLKKILHYQNQINNLIKKSSLVSVENIIQEMIKGTTTQLSKLYLEIYPTLVLYSNILDGLKESWDDLTKHYKKDATFNNLEPNQLINGKPINNYDYIKLARALNKINSNYYIYYYLYQPGKLMGLSRFNYYQIPVEYPTKSFYYDGNAVLAQNLVDISSGIDQPMINLDTVILLGNTTNDHADQSINQLKMLNEGYINNFKVGNYSSILDDYTNMKLPTSNFTSKKDFVIFKESPLPPSLYNALGEFYKFVLIELVKTVLGKIEAGKAADPEKTIWEKSNLLVKTTGIAIDQYNLTTYSLMMKLIQELVKEQIGIYINNAVIAKYNLFISDKTLSTINSSLVLPTKDMQVNLTFSSVKLDTISQKQDVKNMFSLVIQPPKSPIEPFILYPNDLTNINKLRSKYGVIINPKIVEIMMKSSASPYATNADGYSTIFPIIKNYNYQLIQTLKSNGMIDFRSFNESPLTFIQQENLNNLDKFLGSFDISKVKIKDLLGNIDGYLYNDVKSMITANELFGNNILVYLPESFNMSTYLTLQYLSESLDYNSNIDFNIIDFENVIGLINNSQIIHTNLNRNFLGEKLNTLRVPKEINKIIIQHLISEKKKEFVLIIEKINNLDKKDEELKKGDSSIYTKINIKSSKLYLDLFKNQTALKTEIKKLTKMINSVPNLKSNSGIHTIDQLIPSYENYNCIFDNIGLMIKAWSNLLETNLKSNYNLVPIYLINKQKQLVEKITPNNLDDLVKIEKVMNHWAMIAELYFSTKKYTSENQTLVFIEQLLNYITKMVIGNGIELMMRRVLMTWLQNASTTKDYDYQQINEIIEYILESELTGKTDSVGASTNMLKELYEVVCPNLVKNSAEIFENKSDEQAHYVQNTKEILLNYFQLLDLTTWGNKIPSEIKDIFRVQVVNYFDTITTKSISLWFVNVENILKFFINNYRCLKTMMELIR